jgi:RimJ/RimL family protein N-acetyltransferase
MTPLTNPQPVTLEGRAVRLEPMTLSHVPALLEFALDQELWRWAVIRIDGPADIERFVAGALDEQTRGVSVPFVTVDRASGRVVGSTRYLNIVPVHRRLEIGWTFLARPFQRTAVNTEAKLLMLGYAFDVLGCVRVELKTDALNAQSRAAIARLGATVEGIFRRHMQTASGRWRDTAWYSILSEEWPAVREGLQARRDAKR